MKKAKEPKLTRREEFYQFLIGTMLHKNLGGQNHDEYVEYEKKQGYPYFSRDYKVGDIILTQGSLYRNHNPWCIGVCEEIENDHTVIIRDIFSGITCHYSNESFVSVHNVPFRYTLNNKDYKLHKQFSNAIDEVDELRFEFRVWDAIPEKGGVRFSTRRKWEGFEGHTIFIKYRTKSSEMREMLQGIIDSRKEERELSKKEMNQ